MRLTALLFDPRRRAPHPQGALQRPVIAQPPTVAELTTAVIAVSAAASAISELTAATTKHAATECEETNDSDAIGISWGRNRDNPAFAGHQEHVPKKPKT
jgi:hypothetical protein